jgi:hypothetical protein
MRVKFSARLDKQTPVSLSRLKQPQAYRIASDNYGRDWFLLQL